MGSRPHAFVIPYPVQGHILPMLNLCKLLVHRHGFLISFLNSQENHARLASAGADPDAASADSGHCGDSIRMLWLPDTPPSDEDMAPYKDASFVEKSHVALSQAFLNTDTAAVAELVRQQTPRVTCLILDFPAADVAYPGGLCEKLGNIPTLFFFTASAASLCTLEIGASVDGDKARMTKIPGAPELHVSEVNPFLSISGRPGSDYMCRFFTRTAKLLAANRHVALLVNTFEELEGTTLAYLRGRWEGRRVLPVGPVLPPETSGRASGTLWAEDMGCVTWLEGQPEASVLFVSFGSLAPLSSSQLMELALGLEASRQRILWVTRPDLLFGQAPELPPDFLERTKGRILVVPWAPQRLVLEHPAVGGFLTHCGWNSTIESVVAGVPMLTWPFFGDQMLNAKVVCETWRNGSSVSASRLDEEARVGRAEIGRIVRECMEGEQGTTARCVARTLRERALAALGEGGSSYHNLELVVRDLI